MNTFIWISLVQQSRLLNFFFRAQLCSFSFSSSHPQQVNHRDRPMVEKIFREKQKRLANYNSTTSPSHYQPTLVSGHPPTDKYPISQQNQLTNIEIFLKIRNLLDPFLPPPPLRARRATPVWERSCCCGTTSTTQTWPSWGTTVS